jgi:hypothetical protein
MIVSKYLEILIVFIGSIAAIYVGSHVVMLSPPELGLIGALIFCAVWALSAGDYWWTPIISGCGISGLFWIGFKVYPVEIALALAFLGLIPLILVQNEKVFQRHRKALPFIFYLTAAYLTVRFMVDILPAGTGRGSLARIYFSAFWPFLFGFFFHYYAKTSVLRTAIGVAFVLLLLRSLASLVGYFADIPIYIPGINYVLSFTDADSLLAMRSVALTLLVISIMLFHSTRSHFYKLLILPVMGSAVILVVMGGSRFSIVLVLITLLAYFAWARHWILLVFVVSGGVGLLTFINLVPHSLDQLPPNAGRSLSGLVIEKNATGIHASTKDSDIWHAALKTEGFKRWTKSPLTFLFGYGVRPSPDLYETKVFVEDPAEVVSTSADVASYECALWSILAVVGVVGLVLYSLLFLYFWRQIYPYFFRRPSANLADATVFWGGYSCISWYLTCDFQGGFPAMEILLMVIITDLIRDGVLDRKVEARKTLPQLQATPSFALGRTRT